MSSPDERQGDNCAITISHMGCETPDELSSLPCECNPEETTTLPLSLHHPESANTQTNTATTGWYPVPPTSHDTETLPAQAMGETKQAVPAT